MPVACLYITGVMWYIMEMKSVSECISSQIQYLKNMDLHIQFCNTFCECSKKRKLCNIVSNHIKKIGRKKFLKGG